MFRKSIIVLLLLSFVCIPAYAGLQIKQGEKVYLNETIDVTYVVGWEQQLAWWTGNEYSTAPPSLIFDTTSPVYGGQKNFWLDPVKFPVGNYYKWDGKFEEAANPIAFRVVKGTRPDIGLVNGTINETWSNITAAQDYNRTILDLNKPELTDMGIDILVCQGYNYTYTLDSVSGSGQGYLWGFGLSDFIEPIKMSNTTIDIPAGLTRDLEPGDYDFVFQFESTNGLQDIFYNKTKNRLDSQYKLIPAVDLAGIQPRMIKDYLFRMRDSSIQVNPKYSDDVYIEKNVTVVEPATRIREYLESNDFAYVLGDTTIPAGEEIEIWLDAERFNTPQLKATHSWIVKAEGDYNNRRLFESVVPINWDEMAVGEHFITTSPVKFPDKKTVFRFRVGMDWTNPTQTPEPYKVLLEDYGVHRVTVPTSPTPTPEVIYINKTVEVVRTVVVVITPTTPVETPTPESSLQGYIGLAAVCVVAYTVVRKR